MDPLESNNHEQWVAFRGGDESLEMEILATCQLNTSHN